MRDCTRAAAYSRLTGTDRPWVSGAAACNNRGVSDELGEFLRSRRARIRPEDVGFRSGRGRRVEGLRREEVAALASVSVDYIKRLEAGRIRPSEAVLDSLARALQLDAVERTHLFALAGRAAANTVDPLKDVRPGLVRLLAAVEPLPAFVVGPWLDLLAWNPPHRRCSAVSSGGHARSGTWRASSSSIPRSGSSSARRTGTEPASSRRSVSGTSGVSVTHVPRRSSRSSSSARSFSAGSGRSTVR